MAVNRVSRDLFEIMDTFAKKRNRKERIEYLQQNNFSAVTDYLRCVFDDRIQFNLPEGKPPYNPARPESTPSNWFKENVKLQYFVKGLRGDKMPAVKRESIFIGVLEAIHPEDAVLVVDMVNKKTPVKGLTKKLVKEAYPNLF